MRYSRITWKDSGRAWSRTEMSIFTCDLCLGGQQLRGKVLGGGQESQGVLPFPWVAPRRTPLPPCPAQQWPGEQISKILCTLHFVCSDRSPVRDIMFKGSFESLKILYETHSPVSDPHPGVPGPVEQLLRLVGARPGHQPHGGLVQKQSEQFYQH